MRFNLKQMLVFVAFIAFSIAFLRPLVSEDVHSVWTAIGKDHGRQVFKYQFAVQAWPATFMLGFEKPPELEFEFDKHEDGYRRWGNSTPEYSYHSLELTPNQIATIKDSDPEYFGLRVLSIAGWLSGAAVSLVYWAGVLGGFWFAFRWAKRTSPEKA